MEQKARQVKCELSGGHDFRDERNLFPGCSRAPGITYRLICIHCGAYTINPPLAGYRPIHEGPEGRMYEYWEQAD